MNAWRPPINPGTAREVLHLQALVQEQGGVPAIEDELVTAELVRPTGNRWVSVTRVDLENAPARRPFSLSPIFRFAITDEGYRPMHSFAIDSAVAINHLAFADPSLRHLRTPAPAYLDKQVNGALIRKGADLHLMMGLVRVEHPTGERGPELGIRFEVTDADRHLLYSFTIDWPLAFVAIAVAS